MKNLINGLGLVSGVLFLASCSSYTNTYRLTDVPDTRAKVTQTVVDVEPDFTKRIKGESVKGVGSINEAKNNAYYNAIISNSTDVLVDPIYEIKSKKGLFSTKHTASVTGFVGHYKNPRTLASENQSQFDSNLENLMRFVAISPIAKEEKKAVYILNNAGGGCNGASSVVAKEITTTTDLVTRYNNFLSGKSSADVESASFKDAELGEPKKKGLLGNLLGKKK